MDFPKQAAPTLIPAAPQSTSSSVTAPTTQSRTMEIERADYKAEVPQGCNIDPPDPKIDLDHYTAVNLPNGNSLIILVLDDKKVADTTFDKMMTKYRNAIKEPTETASDTFNSRKGKATVVSGKLNGMDFCFEVGVFSGQQKAFIVVSCCERSELDETRQILRHFVDSFVIKE
jgi:hypothetical protein